MDPPLHAWQTSSHTQPSHRHHVKQLLGVSRTDQPLFPLNHPCSPFMLLAGHSCRGKGRAGVQDRSCCSKQREHDRYALYPDPVPAYTMRGTETRREEERKEHLLGMPLELDGFGCFTRSGFPVAAPGGDGWAAAPAFLPCLDASGSKTWLLLMGRGNNCLSAKIKNPFSTCHWSRCRD